MRAPWALSLVSLLVAGCGGALAESDHAAGDGTGRPLRERPTERGMAHAIDRVLDEARQCLRRDDPSVMVAGEFDGARGGFRVTRIATGSGGTATAAVQTCVRAVCERAHVRPFRVSNASFAFTVQPAGGAASASSGGATGADGSSETSSANHGNPTTTSSGSGATNGSTASSATVNAAVGRPSPASLVRAAGETYQRCYEQALERDHRVEGTVTVRMVLDRDGQISRLAADFETDHPDPTLMQLVSRCVEAHVRTIRFGPQYDPGIEVVVPLSFNPGGIRR